MYRKKHVAHALRCLRYLPSPYVAEDVNRMTMAYFALASLELLGELDTLLLEAEKKDYIEWIYRQQLSSGGFRGSPSVNKDLLLGNIIVNSFAAIICLALLQDDFSRLNKHGLLSIINSSQQADGSFSEISNHDYCEQGDLRMIYSAFAICKMLNDWTQLDIDLSLSYLKKCRTYEGGFGMSPTQEAHGGSTFCTLASFLLASRISDLDQDKPLIFRWIVSRQVPPLATTEDDRDKEEEEEEEEEVKEEEPIESSKLDVDLFTGGQVDGCAGFQGRANKKPDACYSFWLNASAKVLDPFQQQSMLSTSHDHAWLLSCQAPQIGGIARAPDSLPDIYHTYMSLAALSIGGHESGLGPLCPELTAPARVVQYLRSKF